MLIETWYSDLVDSANTRKRSDGGRSSLLAGFARMLLRLLRLSRGRSSSFGSQKRLLTG